MISKFGSFWVELKEWVFLSMLKRTREWCWQFSSDLHWSWVDTRYGPFSLLIEVVDLPSNQFHSIGGYQMYFLHSYWISHTWKFFRSFIDWFNRIQWQFKLKLLTRSSKNKHSSRMNGEPACFLNAIFPSTVAKHCNISVWQLINP